VIGTGPFKLESWTPEETTILSANPDWWVTARPSTASKSHHPRRNLEPWRPARR
jgi:ABC-type transport system substrate-binding protein